MTSALMETLLKATAYVCVLLLAGMFLRAKVPVFQKLLLPASVIGGFIGLLFGPNVLGELTGGISLPVSQDFMDCWSFMPGILIVPIFAAAPLGNGMAPGEKKRDFRSYGPKILITFGIFSCVAALQGAVGLSTNLVFETLDPDMGLYRTFGFELGQGFAGGHGTAAALGGILESFGIDYWKTSQSVAITCATVGLIGGMILGILFINRANRAHRLEKLNGSSGQIPKSIRTGIITDMSKQPSIGRESTATSSIDVLTVHLAVILIVCGAAYWARETLMESPIPAVVHIFKGIPVWFVALLMMYAANYILRQLRLSWMIDKKVKSRLTGMMSDVAITAAVASCDVKAVVTYIVPISVMCLLGFLLTYLVVFPLYRVFFKGDYPDERAIICWGTNTGVLINGMMLLKICDPDYETPAMDDFAMGFALFSLTSIPLGPVTWSLVAGGSTAANLGWNLFMGLAYLAVAFVGYFILKRQRA